MNNDSLHSKKIDVLLIARGILAISVLIWHVTGYKGEMSPFLNIPGRTAVWVFFGISGYVMAYGFLKNKYSFTKTDLKSFYLNRVLRIFPLFLLISILSMVTIHQKTGEWVIFPSNVLQQLFMFQFNHNYLLSGVFWTLGIEVQFYLVVPLIAYFLKKEFKFKFVIWFLVYFVMLAWIPLSFKLLGWDFDGRNLTNNISHFFIGMLVCLYVTEKKYNPLKPAILLILVFIVLMFSNYLYQRYLKYYWIAAPFLIDVIIAMLILLHSKVETWVVNDKFRILSFATLMGTISYGIYAWHPYFVFNSTLISSNVLLALVISIGVAYVSYRFFEKPIINSRKKNKIPVE